MVTERDGGRTYQYTFTTQNDELVASVEELCDKYGWSESDAITYLMSKGIEAELNKDVNAEP